MDWLLLTPESTRTASLVVLNLAITAYLVRVPNASAATRWLAVFTGGIVVFYLMRFVEASVYPLEAFGALPHVRMAIETIIVPVALGAFAQFAYRFLDYPFRREARSVLWVTAGLVGGVLLYSIYVLRITPNPPSLYGLYSLVWFGYLVLATFVLLRKSRRLRRESSTAPSASPDRTRRAYHAFAGLSAFFAVILVLITLLNGAQVLPEWMWPLVILPGVFAFFSGLVVVYVNHAPEPTTVQVKLVGLSLATVLALLGMASVVLYPPGEMVRDSSVLPPDGQVVRFAPDATGGYHVGTVTLPPDSALGPIGEPLPLGERNVVTLPLGFSFPYDGAQWDRVTVGDLAVVVAGVPRSIPPEGFRPYDRATEDVPMIAPLFGMLPRRNLSDAQPPQVYLRRTPGRVVLTWQYMAPVGASPPARVQLGLHRDGTIRFAYDGLGFVAWLTPVGPRGGLQGIQPGGDAPSASVRYAQGSSFDLPAATSAIDDLGLRLRQYTHTKSARLFGLLLGATVLILLIAPFVFRSGLLHPLRRLLDGVRRVDTGDLDVEVPVRVRDEVGMLTAHFNRMTDSLRQAEAERQAHADELEDRVVERTAELAASKEQVEQQAERLRELDALKTRFFANISHEFRTPLTLILSPLRDVLDGRAEAEAFVRQAPVMHRNARRLLALINQLLDLAKLEAGGMDLRARPVDLGGFLRRLVLAFAPRAERDGLTLLFDAPDDSVVAPIDPDKLEHVVTNLLSNAFKFTASGGKVRVACQAAADASPSESGDARAEITVEDTGRGIPGDELPHIFDRFYQGKHSTTHDPGGTGIGLALAKELVELHGGTITVTSTVGFGTTFTVRLPLTSALGVSEDEAEPIEESSSPPSDVLPWALPIRVEDAELDAVTEGELASTSGDESATILIVEDHPDMRALVRSYLKAEYRVLEAEDGVGGLDAARDAAPDLIIADVMMPGMDGLQLCRTLKADDDLSAIPVILLTARASEEHRLEGLDHGADAYLTKPFSADELLLRVENLIAVRRQLRERFSGEVVIGPSEVVVPSADAAWLERVQEVVEAHLEDTGFSVRQLADEVGLSTRQLQRKLKAITSLSPNGFIRMMRLERAAQLLEQQAGTVAEIAYAVGFNDADYFSKQFREAFGQPPSAYAAAASQEQGSS